MTYYLYIMLNSKLHYVLLSHANRKSHKNDKLFLLVYRGFENMYFDKIKTYNVHSTVGYTPIHLMAY